MLKLKKVNGRILTVLFLVYLLSYVALFIYNLIFSTSILATLRVSYAFQMSLYMLFDNLIVIQCTGIVLGYSLFLNISSLQSTGAGDISFSKLVSKTVFTLIMLTALYTFITTVYASGLYQDLYRTRFLSRSAVTFLEKARAAQKAGRLDLARDNYRLYLIIDPGNSDISDDFHSLEISVKPLPAEKPPSEPEADLSNLPPLELSKRYYDKEDYGTAYYYATVAIELIKQGIKINKNTQEDLANANRIANKTWEKMKDFNKTKSDQFVQILVDNKKTIMEDLNLGNDKVIDAYYLILETEKLFPVDMELPDFKIQCLNLLGGICFFTDEIEEAVKHPGIQDIAFVNPQKDGSYQIIYFEKLIPTQGETYYYGIHVYEFLASGQLKSYYQYDYGKLIGRSLNFRVIHRELKDRSLNSLPARAEINIDAINPSNISYFSVDTQELLKTMNLFELFGINRDYARAGYNQNEADLEILLRFLFPCLFLILSFISISGGWSLKKQYIASPPLLTYLVIPIVPFLLWIVYKYVLYLHSIVLGFVLLKYGFVLSLITLVVMEFILLVISLLLLSGQSND